MPEEMQLAQILSDLVSLSPGVCDPAAALALVSARPTSSTSSVPISSTSTATPSTESKDKVATEEEDVDLKRARELVELHYAVREKCKTGELARGLAEARGDVERALGG